MTSSFMFAFTELINEYKEEIKRLDNEIKFPSFADTKKIHIDQLKARKQAFIEVVKDLRELSK